MTFTKKLIFLFISISFIAITPCNGQNENLEEKITKIDSLLYSHRGRLALPIIDSLLERNIPVTTALYLKAFKLEALVQSEKLETALNLSNKILKNPNLKGVPLIRTYIERALIYELAGEFEESKKALDFVRDYYKNPKNTKDELYGEFLYRLSSWFRVNNLNKEGLIYAKKAIEFGKQNNYENVEATGLLLLGGLTPKISPSEKIRIRKKALSLYKRSYNYYHTSAMYLSIGESYMKINEFHLSNQYLDSAIPFAKKVNNLNILASVHRLKSSIYEEQGYLKKALSNYKIYQEYTEKDFFFKVKLKVSEINAKFNYEKESLKNKALEQNLANEKKQKNSLLLGLVFLFLLLCSLVYLAFKTAKKRKAINTQAQIIESKNIELTVALSENKLLLKELNHRVNNNLALILSLVKFQYYEIDEPKYKEKIQSLEHRIKTIATAHEQLLYNRENLDGENHDVQEYLSKITNALIDISTKNIKLNLKTEIVNLNIDTMLPIGLLINELVSNSVKHAISENDLIINIIITLHQNTIQLTYKDSGTEFKEATNKKSLGVSIINSMVKQLKGTIIRVDSEYQISLQVKKSKKE